MSDVINPAAGLTTDSEGGVDRIIDAIMANYSGLALPIVRMAVFESLDAFCVRSYIWRQTVTWRIAPEQRAVDLNPLGDNVSIAWVWRVRGLHRYRLQMPAIIIDTGTDYCSARHGDALVVCKPTRLEDMSIPSFLVDQWYEGIKAGALMRLLSRTGMPWADPKMAVYYAAVFRQQVGWARENARVSGDLPRPGFPYFASGHRGFNGFGSSQIAADGCDGTTSCGCGCAGVDGGRF